MSRKCGGDSIGSARTVGGRYFNLHPGILVELGDRVQVRRGTQLIAYAAWGTVIRQRGLGRVRLKLDDGRDVNANIQDLQFEKCGKPLLTPLGGAA